MIRRLHVPILRPGLVELDAGESRHARDVLRLTVGTRVELFDDAGNRADGSVEKIDRDAVSVRVENITASSLKSGLTIASAIPKGERADWMIEKLSEIGVARFVPLITERSVVQASGKNKLARWRRIATESAKQSRRDGVMRIDEPTELQPLLAERCGGFVLSPESDAVSIASTKVKMLATLFIGPEGGWTDAELAAFKQHDIASVRLTDTILRVETAAIVAAAVVATCSRENSA